MSTAQQRSRPLWTLTRWEDLQTPTPQLKRLRSVEIPTEIDLYLQQIALHYVIHYLRRGVWDKVRIKKMSIWLFVPLKAIESLPSFIDWAERKRIFQRQKMFWSFITLLLNGICYQICTNTIFIICLARTQIENIKMLVGPQLRRFCCPDCTDCAMFYFTIVILYCNVLLYRLYYCKMYYCAQIAPMYHLLLYTDCTLY